MSVNINDDCIACGACEPECPNSAISEGDPIYVVNPSLCTECIGFYADQQCINVCPVDAIHADPAHDEDKDALLGKFHKLHPGQAEQGVDSWHEAP